MTSSSLWRAWRTRKFGSINAVKWAAAVFSVWPSLSSSRSIVRTSEWHQLAQVQRCSLRPCRTIADADRRISEREEATRFSWIDGQKLVPKLIPMEQVSVEWGQGRFGQPHSVSGTGCNLLGACGRKERLPTAGGDEFRSLDASGSVRTTL